MWKIRHHSHWNMIFPVISSRRPLGLGHFCALGAGHVSVWMCCWNWTWAAVFVFWLWILRWTIRFSNPGISHLVVWNHGFFHVPQELGWWSNHDLPPLVGGLKHELYVSIQLGMSSSQLTFTPSFVRGVGSTTNQYYRSIVINHIITIVDYH